MLHEGCGMNLEVSQKVLLIRHLNHVTLEIMHGIQQAGIYTEGSTNLGTTGLH